nr:MAG TPA: hypothetical protein [Caudoviricetes sp.]DAJ18181.1 MAG TPA: hypothetical protein [Podoviridae sp. ctY3D12]
MIRPSKSAILFTLPSNATLVTVVPVNLLLMTSL